MLTNNKPSLAVQIGGLSLRNPVMTASGTFGYGEEFTDFMSLDTLGAYIVKGTTLEPREGNDYPRMAETPSGMLNAVGLQNKGVEYFISHIYDRIKDFDSNLIVNVSGSSPDDYGEVAGRLARLSNVNAIEVNISCPNVHNGGMAFGTTPEAAAQVTAATKKVSHKPLFVKLSPNVTDIVSIARACEDAGADGLTLVNTFLGMRIDIKRRQTVVAAGAGGFSGRAIFPIAVRMVNQVSKACSIPIMGCGGIASAEDVIEMMMAGANAVQIGAENIRNPFVCKEIVEALPLLMDSLGITCLSEITGIV